MVVFKYPLAVTDRPQSIDMPVGAQVLHVDVQDDRGLHLWALVDRDRPNEQRTLVVRGTGQVLPDGALKHLGTALDREWGLVWHVFEEQV